MKTITLEGPLASLREDEIKLVYSIADTIAEIGDDSDDDRRRLRDVAQDLAEMFFIVAVIGEFNAGKSTFINALLGDQLLPTGITPTTEAIELIRYGDDPVRKPQLSEDGRLRQWAHPNTGAPGVAIVDTPGTGSVFEKHDIIAKDFLHRSDLVIFLISSKRAFAETERMYLDLARSFGKKTIVVINQVDLLEPSELVEVRNFIERQVRELLNIEPLIFPVSAKKAMAGEDGGIDPVRAHLRGVFAETPPTKQKLLTQLDLAETVVKKYLKKIQGDTELVLKDTTKVKDVQAELEKQSLGLEAQYAEANAEIEKIFESLRQRGHTFIDTNLSLRKMMRVPSRAQLQADFQDVVIGRALRDINEATGGYINAVIDNSRAYWRGVIERLKQLQDLMEQELGGLDATAYAQQRESLQEAIRIARAELESYSSGGVISQMRDVFETDLNAFTASAIAAIGGVIAMIAAVAAPGTLLSGTTAWALPVFIVAAVPAAIGGVAAFRYYRRVTTATHQDFDERVDKLLSTYRDSLSDLSKKERNRLRQYGNQVLTPVFSRLEVLAARYGKQQDQLEDYLHEIDKLRERIKAAP